MSEAETGGVYGGLSADHEQLLRSDPRKYMKMTWRHPTDPSRRYDFYDTNRNNRLDYLLHDDGPLNPDNWGGINVLKFARGCLKTTSVTGIASWAHHMFLPWGMRGYMTAPREKPPITGFMRQFDKVARQTGLDAFRTKDNQKEQGFEVSVEEDGSTYPVTSVLEADSGYDPDTLRGPHSHYGIIDEFQDIGKAAFDTYSQCIDQEVPGVDYFPAIFLIGTPKTTTDFYADIWRQSDQRRWDAEEKKWIQESEPEEHIPAADALPTGTDVDDLDPDTVRGWHIDQQNCPLHSPTDIAASRKNLSKQKFQNEVRAVFYDPEDNLLGRSDVEEHLFDPSLSFKRDFEDISDGSYVTLAVDWGGGGDAKAADTVIAVAEHQTVGSQILTTFATIDVLDSSLTASEEVREVEERINQYRVDRAVVDHGHGYHALESLQDGDGTMDPDGYADTVVGCRFGNIRDKGNIKWEQNSGKRRFFTVDKTNMVDNMVKLIKQGQMTIPQDIPTDLQEKIMNHLTAPYKDYTTTPSGSKKIRVQTDDSQNDDIFDTSVYTYIARHEVGPMNMPSTVTMNTRRGY